ncbi:MAG: hypothetical protein B7C24_07550 [Bacteroidetes bacterium 4572_77]|nr:MAG: hypothetical protein B7C24_07550 [Bacteroidetes bacterium 4572_77]
MSNNDSICLPLSCFHFVSEIIGINFEIRQWANLASQNKNSRLFFKNYSRIPKNKVRQCDLRASSQLPCLTKFSGTLQQLLKKGHPSSAIRVVLFFLITVSKFGIFHKFQKEAWKKDQQYRLILNTIGEREQSGS